MDPNDIFYEDLYGDVGDDRPTLLEAMRDETDNTAGSPVPSDPWGPPPTGDNAW